MKTPLTYTALLSFSLFAFAGAAAPLDSWQRLHRLAQEAKHAALGESLRRGVTVGSLLAPIEQTYPSSADRQALGQFLRAHKISRQEIVKAKTVAVAEGKISVSLGSTGTQTITIASGQKRHQQEHQTGQISLNGHGLLIEAQPLSELIAQVEKILAGPRAERRWNWLVPTAEATPVALVGIGTLVGLAAITMLMEDPDSVAYHLKEQASACAKEMADRRVAYGNSSTKKVADDLARRGLLGPHLEPILESFGTSQNPRGDRGARADCEAFAARAVEGDRAANRQSRLKAGDVLSACKAAQAFSDCANKFRSTHTAGHGASPNETEAPASASGAN